MAQKNGTRATEYVRGYRNEPIFLFFIAITLVSVDLPRRRSRNSPLYIYQLRVIALASVTRVGNMATWTFQKRCPGRSANVLYKKKYFFLPVTTSHRER
jgi:hypothetical protein